MENTGFKGLLVTLWQRVIVSYKTTLIGLGIVAAGVIADAFVASPNKVLATVGAVVGGVLALIKEQKPHLNLAPPAE